MLWRRISIKLNLNKKEIKFITFYLDADLKHDIFDNEEEYDILNWIKCCIKHETEYINAMVIDEEDIILNEIELTKLLNKLEEED